MSISEIKGISGWLTLVAIGLVLSPFRFYFETLSVFTGLFEAGTWHLLTDQTSTAYSKDFAILLYVELAFNIFLFSGFIYLNFLFFAKKSTFPKTYIVFAVIGLLYIPLDAYLVSTVAPNETMFDSETTKNFFVTLVSAAIWVPYMLRSRRVKNTFVEEHSFRKLSLSFFSTACISVALFSAYLTHIKHVPEVVTIEDKLVQVANEANKSLPKVIDSETQLDAIRAEFKNFQYHYSLVNYDATEIDANVLNNNLRSDVLQMACSSDFLLEFMKDGVTVSYSYFGKLGKHITSIDIINSDCV
ncbi:hypothetical protein MACH09_38080 [Vibrio sp. MACH09]|uniref:DUF2569 domain-containing protein n=1 Tax=Vibrio sp. MACH09 TaxID=3025122 RepID=UPI00278DE13E|nr:DUF2569 domain-containing protein [Vibrio sp. MACH09]GLO63300.1 hypothetical protein MACH09_38080 [Vibrio sp. MACH09]